MSYVLPTIGVSGIFELAGDLQNKINATETYTCQGIRTIWDYESVNEDIKKKAYLDNGLTEDQYLADKEVNMHILSLQGHMGMWIYVPARFVLRYPDHNGVRYQAKIVTIGLPPMPMDTDLDGLVSELRSKTISATGIEPQIKVVEASHPVMVSSEEHAQITATRAAAMNGYVTQDVTIGNLQRTVDEQRHHIEQLEAFIASLGL